MANFSAINSIYNYYLTTYAPKTDSKFDTHKKSELKSVYNSIVKMNKEAPLFIVDKTQDTKEYAVGLKENARALHNTIASLGGISEADFLNKKVAFSSDDSLAEANFIGNDDAETTPLDLKVLSLAKPQVNTGYLIPSDELSLDEGTYSFDIGINGLNYEFQYNVASKDTNKSLQEKLSRLISNSGIGLKAEVYEDGQGNSSLQVSSETTGDKSQSGSLIFTVSDDHTSKTKGSIEYFGLNNVIQSPTNAAFSINGEDFESLSNTFTVDKNYEVTIKRVSNGDEDSAHIDLKNDMDSLVDNVEELVEGYNSFIDTTESYTANHPKADRLVSEMSSVASIYEDKLSNVGVTLENDGHIAFDKEKLRNVSLDEESMESLNSLKKFAGAMLKKADQVSLNPMKYADKTIVAYKNPGHNFATPYVTSAYTGMMFNSYC